MLVDLRSMMISLAKTLRCVRENFRFLSQRNDEMKFFKRIIPLSHPRFIMQYRRKKVADYVADYISKLNA